MSAIEDGAMQNQDGAQIDELVERITAYLAGGGLWNPELADHTAVSRLIRDCRDALESQAAELDAVYGILGTASAEPAAHTIDCLMTDLAASKDRIASLEVVVREMREALLFYADPFGVKDAYGEEVRVPDFYDEMNFGERAESALATSESVGKSEGEKDGVE